MKAIVTTGPRPAEDPRALEERDLPMPTPGAGDLRVRIEAVSVNPVDTKLRRAPLPAGADHRVLGFDAAGTVDAVGEQNDAHVADVLGQLDEAFAQSPPDMDRVKALAIQLRYWTNIAKAVQEWQPGQRVELHH